MAQVANPIVRGWSGKFDNTLVFRTMRGRTFVAAAPRKADRKKETAAQRQTRTTFREAAAWAQHVLQDAKTKQYYTSVAKRLKLPNAYTAAITEYMRKPKVLQKTEPNRVVVSVSKPAFVLKQVRVEGDNKASVKKKEGSWLVMITRSATDAPRDCFIVIEDAVDREWREVIRI